LIISENKKKKRKKEKRKKEKEKKKKVSSGSTSSSTCRYHERALEKCGFWEKQKNQIWKKSAKSKKKIYEKSWTATAFVSKRPKEKARAFVLRAFVFFRGGVIFLEHTARTAAYYNRIRMRPARHSEDR
jgi:hypothetical protein